MTSDPEDTLKSIGGHHLIALHDVKGERGQTLLNATCDFINHQCKFNLIVTYSSSYLTMIFRESKSDSEVTITATIV